MPIRIHHFAVVDSNARSRPGPAGLVAALSDAITGGPIPLIPDALVTEMLKAEGSARAWAKILGTHPNCFALSRSPYAIIRDEVEGSDSPLLIHQEGTAEMRHFVEDYKVRGEPALVDQMAGIEEALANLRSTNTMFNVGFVRGMSQLAIDEFVKSLPSNDVASARGAVRRGISEVERREIKLRLIQHPDTLALIAVQVAQNEQEAGKLSELVLQPTFVRAAALLILAEIAHALEHELLVRGLADKNLVNDAVDGQGVLLSALCADFLTSDGRSLELHDLVRAGMNLPAGRVSSQLPRTSSE